MKRGYGLLSNVSVSLSLELSVFFPSPHPLSLLLSPLLHSSQVRTQSLQSEKRAFTRTWTCWHFDVWLLASRNVTNVCLLLKPPSLWFFCQGKPSRLRHDRSCNRHWEVKEQKGNTLSLWSFQDRDQSYIWHFSCSGGKNEKV